MHGLGDVGYKNYFSFDVYNEFVCRGSWHEAFNMCRIAKSMPYAKLIFPTA